MAWGAPVDHPPRHLEDVGRGAVGRARSAARSSPASHRRRRSAGRPPTRPRPSGGTTRRDRPTASAGGPAPSSATRSPCRRAPATSPAACSTSRTPRGLHEAGGTPRRRRCAPRTRWSTATRATSCSVSARESAVLSASRSAVSLPGTALGHHARGGGAPRGAGGGGHVHDDDTDGHERVAHHDGVEAGLPPPASRPLATSTPGGPPPGCARTCSNGSDHGIDQHPQDVLHPGADELLGRRAAQLLGQRVVHPQEAQPGVDEGQPDRALPEDGVEHRDVRLAVAPQLGVRGGQLLGHGVEGVLQFAQLARPRRVHADVEVVGGDAPRRGRQAPQGGDEQAPKVDRRERDERERHGRADGAHDDRPVRRAVRVAPAQLLDSLPAARGSAPAPGVSRRRGAALRA